MGNDLLSSKVVVQEEPPRIRNIAGVPTAVTAALGVTKHGPVGVPTFTTSFAEWTKIFGSYIADSDLAQSVEGFYQNKGGGQLWTSRIVHYSDISDPDSKTSAKATKTLNTAAVAPSAGTVLGAAASPFDLEPGDTIQASIDGAGAATATFNAAAGVVTAVNAGPYALANNQTLLVAVNGGTPQSIAFLTAEFANIAAATAAEVIAVINAKIVGARATLSGGLPRITTDRRGSSASVQVTGGTAAAAFAFPGGAQSGTGNVANIDAVTASEVIAVLEAAISGQTTTQESGQIRLRSDSTGPSSSVQILSASTADDELGFDNAVHSGGTGAAVPTLQVDGKWDGTYGNGVRPLIVDASSGDADRFNLHVEDNGLVVERWTNLTMDDSDPLYVETVLNDPDTGSDLVAVLDLAAAGTVAERRPANATGAAMTGGNDGLSGLADVDFTGNAAGGTGLRALDQTLGIRILTVPGRATAAVQNAMVSYAEFTRSMEMFPVLDPPEGLTASQMRTYVLSTAALRGLTEFGAIYWPRVKVLNPNKSVFGPDEELVVPPSLHIAGMFARTDASKPGGVYVPPAGEVTGRLLGVVGLETDEVLDEGKRDLIFPDLINPITRYEAGPIHCDGARTLKDTGNFPTIGERRGVIYIEQSVKEFLRVYRHQNNTSTMRAGMDRSITSFLLIQMNNDAFQTRDPATAFFVDTSKAINPPSVVFARQARARLGLATNKPAEFILLLVSQDTRALEEELAATATAA